ncbi:hypothetical protein DKX38_011597 [Salix brachista]|uniref:Peroxidase n=1 Tax=Salix brachista TaxID=2182728 RepID=A0A5N5M1L6_9ROSI|nr:hypothetical protein DKX38_011597 [Salix brachista]
MLPLLAALLLLVSMGLISASIVPLRPGFYDETCPEAEFVVKDAMRRNMIREPRSAASVMRFQFHDCLVNGCDASVLLDDTPNMLGEKLALSNIDSLRSYEVIDEVKEDLETVCPGTVSCADIIIMASRTAVVLHSAAANKQRVCPLTYPSSPYVLYLSELSSPDLLDGLPGEIFKDQIKAIHQAIDAKEDNFEKLQKAKLEKAKELNADPSTEENVDRVKDISRFIKIQDKEMEEFKAERKKLIRRHEDEKGALMKIYWEELLGLEKEFENELTLLIDKYTPQIRNHP